MTDAESSNCPVVTDIFEGPIDLLLHLIRKHEIDIYDIPIVDIAVQYNKYLNILREIDLDLAGEYLVMAATLVYIKSRNLLPRQDEIEGEDQIADELVRDMEEFRKYKAAADLLREKESSRELVWSRPETVSEEFIHEVPDEVDAELLDLVEAFRDLLKDRTDLINLTQEEFSVEDKIEDIMTFLENRKSVNFKVVFESMRSRMEMIVAFLALLELIKMGVIKAYQSAKTGDIRIYKKKEIQPVEVLQEK